VSLVKDSTQLKNRTLEDLRLYKTRSRLYKYKSRVTD